MKLKKHILRTLLKKSSKYSFWIDYLRLNITDVKSWIIKYNNDIVNLCDFDNSNWTHLTLSWYDLTAQKIKLSNGTWLIYSYSYFGISIPLFIYIEYNSNTKHLTNSIWKLDFYGSFFRLLEIWVLTSFPFSDFILWCEISRLDYRLDLFDYEGWLISPSVINARKNSFYQFFRTGWVINSWKFWNSKNKTVVVRWYDKKLDISKKWKFRLYWDYQEYNTVFRLEWEFLNKFCKWYNFSDLDKLVNIAKNYIWIENNFQWKYLQSYEKLDLTNEYEKTKYCKLMSAYIKNALKNNIDVYTFVDIELCKLWLSPNDANLIRIGQKKLTEFNLLTL